MRNIFDQYKHPENRLTHALASCLAQDRRVLKAFCLNFSTHHSDMSDAYILEQSVPWLVDISESEYEQKGLPDALIYTDEGNAVVIESKIGSTLTNDQLLRHSRTLTKHGFKKLSGIAITVSKYEKLPDGWVNVLWVDVYKFLKNLSGFWPDTAAEYFEILEERMIAEETLLNGPLTSFAGIPFNDDNKYNYLEAKRLLKLLRPEIGKDLKAVKTLNIDVNGQGRNKISNQEGVWDFFQFRDLKYGPKFNDSPHMTFGIRKSHADAHITFPDKMKGELNRKFKNLSLEEFGTALEEVYEHFLVAFKGVAGAKPIVKLVQRHYPSQSAQPILDAELEADLRTIFRSGTSVKLLPYWLSAVHGLITNKTDANLQFQFGCQFDYAKCERLKDENAHELFIESWRGARIFIDKLMGG